MASTSDDSEDDLVVNPLNVVINGPSGALEQLLEARKQYALKRQEQIVEEARKSKEDFQGNVLARLPLSRYDVEAWKQLRLAGAAAIRCYLATERDEVWGSAPITPLADAIDCLLGSAGIAAIAVCDGQSLVQCLSLSGEVLHELDFAGLRPSEIKPAQVAGRAALAVTCRKAAVIRIVDAYTFAHIRDIDLAPFGGDGPDALLSLPPNGRLVAALCDLTRTLHVVSCETGKQVAKMSWPHDFVEGMCPVRDWPGRASAVERALSASSSSMFFGATSSRQMSSSSAAFHRQALITGDPPQQQTTAAASAEFNDDDDDDNDVPSCKDTGRIPRHQRPSAHCRLMIHDGSSALAFVNPESGEMTHAGTRATEEKDGEAPAQMQSFFRRRSKPNTFGHGQLTVLRSTGAVLSFTATTALITNPSTGIVVKRFPVEPCFRKSQSSTVGLGTFFVNDAFELETGLVAVVDSENGVHVVKLPPEAYADIACPPAAQQQKEECPKVELLGTLRPLRTASADRSVSLDRLPGRKIPLRVVGGTKITFRPAGWPPAQQDSDEQEQ